MQESKCLEIDKGMVAITAMPPVALVNLHVTVPVEDPLIDIQYHPLDISQEEEQMPGSPKRPEA